MKKIITSACLIFLFSIPAYSQSAGTPSEEKKQDTQNIPEIVKMQQDFDAWAKGKDLSKEKGWKWYKRWEEQMIRRANPDGSLPDEYEYFNAAVNVALQKEQVMRANSASWI